MDLNSESVQFLLWTTGPAILLAFSNILQKIGLDRVAHKVHTKRPLEWVWTVVRNFPWWCGIAIAAVATVGYYGAIGRYNISLVQPLMALNPVLTALAGWLFLKEHMDRRTASAILLVVLGLCFAGFLHGEAHGTENQRNLVIFSLLLTSLVFTTRFFVANAEARKSLIAGIGFGLSAVLIKSIEEHFKLHGGFALEAWRVWLPDPAVFLRGIGYVITYLVGFIYMQVALTHGRALLVIPLVSAIGMLVPSIAGIVVFQEPFGFAKLAAIGLVMAGSALFVRLK